MSSNTTRSSEKSLVVTTLFATCVLGYLLLINELLSSNVKLISLQLYGQYDSDIPQC